MKAIKFGTSGWRAILGDAFSFRNVRIVAQAIAQTIRQSKQGQQGIIIGHDSRFMGEQFAQAVAEVMAAHGIPALLCDRETPTPTLSAQILHHHLAGGINISASHNPPEYNGMKFTADWGGPALPETTEIIEQRIAPLLHGEHVKWVPIDQAKKNGMVRVFDPKPEYFSLLEKHVDAETIRRADLRIVMDPLYGTSRGYLDEFLRQAGAKMAVLHHWRDPYFGGLSPEPNVTSTHELQKTVLAEQAQLGVATDGDADRFGIVDQDGSFVEPNLVIALLLDYLITTRGWKGTVGRSIATTHLVDRVAAYHGLGIQETSVGFKYLGGLLSNGTILMGGEESAGLSIQGHVPEKDGILACLLVTEMVARTGKTLSTLMAELSSRVGQVFNKRNDFPIPEDMRSHLDTVKQNPPEQFAGQSVQEVKTLDGCQFLLKDGSWFLFRPSGTEPLVRCYGEASTPEGLDLVMREGAKLLSIPR